MAEKDDGIEKNYHCLECFRIMTFEQVMRHHEKTAHKFRRVDDNLTDEK